MVIAVAAEMTSLQCTTHWDPAPCAGAENAVACYKSNRDPTFLNGAETVRATVGDYWRMYHSSSV